MSEERTEAALRFLEGDGFGLLELPGGVLRRERGRLYLRAEGEPAALPERELPEEGTLAIPEAGLVLRCEKSRKKEEIHGLFKTCELKCEKIHGKLVCTGPREGDRFHPAHRGCGKSLRALFREEGLTRRESALVPVLRDEEGIAAVLGFGQDARCAAACGDPVIRITWTEEAE